MILALILATKAMAFQLPMSIKEDLDQVCQKEINQVIFFLIFSSTIRQARPTRKKRHFFLRTLTVRKGPYCF